MDPILTRCGYRCDLCLAYRPNVTANSANRQKLSDGWFKYFGFRLPPEAICCDGCMADNPQLIDRGCPVRPCVIERGLDNCAQCERYVCEKLTERLVVYEEIQLQFGADIPEDDRSRFIHPYENRRRLEALRGLRRLQGTNVENVLADPDTLVVHAQRAERATWNGQGCLRLENGLVLLPDFIAQDARIEVWVGTDGPAYPGIAFRVADTENYELAYPVPHVSGQWDAVQYDPVFHGSNTWQLYYGPAYQGAAEVPTGRWFHLQVDVRGERAAIAVDGRPPLVVERVAHPVRAGQLGLWTYLPAYFRDLRVTTPVPDIPAGTGPTAPAGAVTAWHLEGHGVVEAEPNGVVNLNRFLSPSASMARLVGRLEMAAAGEVEFDFGHSDALSLELNGHEIWSGENTFHGFADRAARGYAEIRQSLRQELAAGVHQLAAVLRVQEGFGWGLVLAVRGEGVCWMPAE